jgi:ABC-type lipoprotein release transport system permease subunit
LAGNFSLIDLGSFRDLYGFLTESRRKQNQEIESEMGIKDLGKEDMEALFGEEGGAPTTVSNQTQTNTAALGVEEKNDVFINAAIFLSNPDKLDDTLKSIEKINEKEKLGIKVVDWRNASGIVGQMTTALRIILFSFVLVLFIIASLMIMNSLLMATMERQQEIGTMRAIGAPKAFLYKVYLIETAVTSILFSLIGSILALIVIHTVGKEGIPAQGDVAKFFFSGPKLYFYTHWDQIIFVFVVILLISFIETQYPAWRAMKISPLSAMQNRD